MGPSATSSRQPLITGIAFAVWLVSTIYNLIGFAVAIDAIDEGSDRPAWTSLAGLPAIAISIAAFLVFLAGVIAMTAKRRRSGIDEQRVAKV